MKKETEVGKIGYLLYCDGTQCKRCLIEEEERK